MISSGFVSLLYSVGKRPLEFWSKYQSQTGRIRKILDLDSLENVLEIQDLQKSCKSNTFITSPPFIGQLLDVRLPFLVIIIKNMNVEFAFRVQIIDEEDTRHHFYFSNEPLSNNVTSLPLPLLKRVEIKLEPGWNRVEIDLEDLTRRVFKSRYKATQRIAICANCRLRRIYFVERHYDGFEMAAELYKAIFNHYVMREQCEGDSMGRKYRETLFNGDKESTIIPRIVSSKYAMNNKEQKSLRKQIASDR